MVSIVIVSHSPDLAKGIKDLADQMTQGKVNISVAAGVDDPENPIGTDSVAIMSAIEEVYSSDGVLVFVDMGSAILSTDMALELIDPDMAENVFLCAAPIVEGIISASVAAMAGKSVTDVIDEAHCALRVKYELLNQSDFFPFSESRELEKVADVYCPQEVISQEYRIRNPHGLHARPAAAIVSAMVPFDAEISLFAKDKKANAKSINSIALLGIKSGDTVTLRTSGTDAQKALGAFSSLYDKNFYDLLDECLEKPQEILKEERMENISSDQTHLSGVGVCNGIAVSPILRYEAASLSASQRSFSDSETEWQLFLQARKSVTQDLDALADKLTGQGMIAESEIFQAHAQMLDDPELEAALKDRLEKSVNIEQAWEQVVAELAVTYKGSDSSYMQARAKDVYDIGEHIMAALMGRKRSFVNISEPVILAGNDFLPSVIAHIDTRWVKGLVIQVQDLNSHAVILAKALGIPTVAGADSIMQVSQNGHTAILNGQSGDVWLAPTQEEIKKIREAINS